MRYKKFFTMSYDDGVLQDQKLMKILADYDLRITFNINSGLLGKEGFREIDGKKIDVTTVAENNLCANYSRHEVATHGVTHAHLETLNHGDLVREITQDRVNLATIVGYEINGHAYPYGYPLDPSDLSIADVIRKECNIAYARTTASTGSFAMPKNRYLWNPTCRHDDPHLMEIVDEFIKTEPTSGDLCLHIWGCSAELDLETENCNWDNIKRVCEKISERRDKREILCKDNLFIANKLS